MNIELQRDLYQKIDAVYAHLSPEHLSCDGELPRSAVARRYRELTSQLKALFKQLGDEPGEYEVNQWLQKNPNPNPKVNPFFQQYPIVDALHS